MPGNTLAGEPQGQDGAEVFRRARSTPPEREELQSQDTPASAGPEDSLPGSQDSCPLPKAGAW